MQTIRYHVPFHYVVHTPKPGDPPISRPGETFADTVWRILGYKLVWRGDERAEKTA